VNSAFCVLWFVSSEVISKTIHLWANGARDLKIYNHLSHLITFWSTCYSAGVVYTKTIIHFSVGESDGYLPPLRWIIVNYLNNTIQEQYVGSVNDCTGNQLQTNVWVHFHNIARCFNTFVVHSSWHESDANSFPGWYLNCTKWKNYS